MNSRLVPVSLTNLSMAALLAMAACNGDDSGSGNTAATTGTTGTTPTSAAATTQTTAMTNADTTATNTDGDSTGATTGADTTADTGTTGGNKIACPYTPIEGDQSVGLELVADGFASPLLVVGDPVEQDVLYVVQKGGEIKRLEPGMESAPAANWLDIPVANVSEAGLLGLAFHPDYADNNLIYVLHSESTSAWRITEYPVEGGTPNVDAGREVFGVAQPLGNHNGGMIQFGPDGYLYISVGDGGPQGDACGNGQDGSTHHGSILRIDVAEDGQPDSATSCGVGPGCNCPPLSGFDFTIPADNPFVGDPSVRDEIYAIGFRNPWRFSFDAVDGSLWVGDVGQNGFEEVTVVEAGSNHGWGDMEGNNCFSDVGCDSSAAPGQTNADGLVAPIVDYALVGGRSAVIGLGNYRSCEVAAFGGIYFYGDLGTGEVFAVAYDGTDVNDFGVVTTVPNGDSMYGGGYNAYGDVFIAAVPQFGGSGSIYRVTAL